MAFPKPRRQERIRAAKQRREERNAEIGRIRDAVFDRARQFCENPECHHRSRLTGLILDHWLGGSGRRRQRESVATCWALCVWCNAERTANLPDAATWNRRFASHAARYGFDPAPHRVD